MTGNDDPFHHLHDENYAGRLLEPRLTAATLISTAGRSPRELRTGWTLTPDLYDEGLRQSWFAFDKAPISDWRVPRDWDGQGEPCAVPASWNLLKPEWRHFEGGMWYALDLTEPQPKSDEKVFLYVGAANYTTRIFLNGRFLASHCGGSTPFCVEIGDELRPVANRLLIHVENRREPERVPMHHTDWFNYGGIHRPVSILRLPAVFIRDVFARLVRTDQGLKLRLSLELSDQVDGEATLAVGDGTPMKLAVAAGQGEIECAIPLRLWSPDDPHLTPISVSFGADTWRDRVGLRLIERRGCDLLLNGRPIFLRGVCVHEDDIETGRVSSEADIRRRFEHARALGANFLRLAHYPHDERAARIADELGLMLWAEVPVYWAIGFANPATLADAENQLRELIRRDRNRASTIIWGVGNENADTNARLDFMSRLAAAARDMDETRLVSAACLINRAEFRIEDRLAGHLDVIGVNEYFGWYEEGFEGLDRLLANSRPDRPVIITEFGADALAGFGGEVGQLFSEAHQAHVYREQFRRILATPYVRGACPWLLYDFRTDRRQTRLQRGWNLKGLMAADKTTRKLAFGEVAAIYRALAESGGA